ncbi:MAG: FkbM family methyltransferase, partial [Thermodesulfobacteriota bacterium]
FYKNEQDSVWGTACPNWAERNKRLGTSSRLIEVNIIDFKQAIEEHGVPYYMKVDIEGCDMVCINALRKFRERPDYISFESDKTSFSNIKHEIALLSYLGYSKFQAVEQSLIPVSQSPPFPPREGRYVAQCFERGASGLFGAELDDKWKSKQEILRLYRFIAIGYLVVGDDGLMTSGDFEERRGYSHSPDVL